MTPKPVGPVAYRGKMTKAGWQPENHEWRDELCDTVVVSSWTNPETGKTRTVTKLVGKDPMTLSLDVLSAAGHPQTRASALVFRLRIMQGQDTGEMRDDPLPFPAPRRLTEVRDYCLGCSNGSVYEVRRCPIYDCPAWAFRMGHNPHNPRRGVNPFPNVRP